MVFGTTDSVGPLPVPEVTLADVKLPPPTPKSTRAHSATSTRSPGVATSHAAGRQAEAPPVVPERKPLPQERRVVKPEAVKVPAAPANELAGELERLHAQMDEIRALIVRSASARMTAGRSVPELADVYARLMTSEVDSALSKDIVDRLGGRDGHRRVLPAGSAKS